MPDSPPPVGPPSLWQQMWDAAPRISGIVAAVTVVIAVVGFLFGGIKPQSQIDLETLKAAVAAHQTQLATLPRDKDFQEWALHLSSLDRRADGLKDDATQMKFDIKDLTNRLQALSTSKGNR